MTIRFQADADINQSILLAAIRREPALDFQTAAAGGLIGLADADVLAISAQEGRLLVTHDRKSCGSTNTPDNIPLLSVAARVDATPAQSGSRVLPRANFVAEPDLIRHARRL